MGDGHVARHINGHSPGRDRPRERI
jgi:hypothetical protein